MNPTIWLALNAVHIFLTLSTGTVTLSWVAENIPSFIAPFIDKFCFYGWGVFSSKLFLANQAD